MPNSAFGCAESIGNFAEIGQGHEVQLDGAFVFIPLQTWVCKAQRSQVSWHLPWWNWPWTRFTWPKSLQCLGEAEKNVEKTNFSFGAGEETSEEQAVYRLLLKWMCFLILQMSVGWKSINSIKNNPDCPGGDEGVTDIPDEALPNNSQRMSKLSAIIKAWSNHRSMYIQNRAQYQMKPCRTTGNERQDFLQSQQHEATTGPYMYRTERNIRWRHAERQAMSVETAGNTKIWSHRSSIYTQNRTQYLMKQCRTARNERLNFRQLNRRSMKHPKTHIYKQGDMDSKRLVRFDERA